MIARLSTKTTVDQNSDNEGTAELSEAEKNLTVKIETLTEQVTTLNKKNEELLVSVVTIFMLL